LTAIVQLSSIAFADSGKLPILSETSTDMYITRDGPTNLLAGDGTQLWEHDPDDYNQKGNRAFEEEIAAGLMRFVSAAEHAELRRCWARLCGGTPDRRPLLGGVSERLFIVCGDNGFGVVRGPALGELGCRIAMGVDAAPQVDPFRFPPGEFSLRPGSGGMFPETASE
jgi:glycine/D-amino acid oxidase-like deaminating enzyme